MAVVISPNIKKTTERIDLNGNKINPQTKEVIEEVEKPYIPTAEELQKHQNIEPQPVEVTVKSENPMDIQKEIEVLENKLALLKDKKRLAIEEMKKQLAELEK